MKQKRMLLFVSKSQCGFSFFAESLSKTESKTAHPSMGLFLP